MKESCKVCRKWQHHAYWSHMDPTNIKFFVEMESSFRRYLNLPRKIAKNFKGKISERIKLKDPNGKTWKIEVFKSYNNVSLRSGWTDFVTANKIDENDLLIFTYSSSSSFDVLIFDASGYEKADPLMIKNEDSKSESESETMKTSSDSDTSIRVFIPPAKISSKSVISSPEIRAENKREMNDDGTSRHASKKANQALSVKPYHVPCKLKLSVKQQKIADEMASTTQPGSKLFLKIMTSSDLQDRLTIPRTFARQNIGKRSQQISLLAANNKKFFPANYKYKEKLQSIIGRGWRAFALENNIKERNMCLFEVKKLDVTEIVVHVSPRAN